MRFADDSPMPLEALEDQRVRSLLVVASAIGGAQELAEVLESAAEAARVTLGVSTVSIRRWDHDAGLLRTLINVGDLGPGQERRPTEETYPVDAHPVVHRVLHRREPHITHLDDPDGDRIERGRLEALRRQCSAAVAIVVAGATWGDLSVTRSAALGSIAPADVAFMRAVAAQVALGLGRAERVQQLIAAAYCDPLTGLPNRRAFGERLDEALLGTQPVTLLLADVDRLKRLNDRDGHDAGDRALRAVAGALAAATPVQALAARIGGDEFCVVLEGLPAATATALVEEVTARLEGADSPIGLSWGVASTADVARRAGDLLIAADAHQYRVKRRTADAARAPLDAPPASDRRRHRDAPGEPWDAVARLLREGLALLDAAAYAGTSADQRARAVVALAGRVLGGEVPILAGAGPTGAAPAAVTVDPRWLASWSSGIVDALTLLLREASRR
jgi:diguanylate cyclase (GGDEF)-like protein